MAERLYFSIATLRERMKTDGMSARWNEITQSAEYEQNGICKYGQEIADYLARVHSDYSESYRNVNPNVLRMYFNAIAGENSYNPVLDILGAVEWDGADRFEELFDAMGIEPNDYLSRILVQKWFMQGVALLTNKRQKHPFGADGLLVLYGNQGIGKTSFLRWAAIDETLFGEGLGVSSIDKDCQRRCVTCFICELGELESTFRKADVDALKNFVTTARDRYRLPYAAQDTDEPRKTNLAATANGCSFLRDETGNRRYWCVPCGDDFSIEKTKRIDAVQVWKEAEHLIECHGIQSFRLTQSEREMLNERNAGLMAKTQHEDEVRDVLTRIDATPNRTMKLCTVSEWAEHYGLKISTQQVATALTRAGFSEQKRAKVNGCVSRLRLLPWTEYGSTPLYKIGTEKVNEGA